MQGRHELVEPVEHSVCHRLEGHFEPLLHNLKPLGEVVGVISCAGDCLAVFLQLSRQVCDGQRAVSDRCGHRGARPCTEDLRRDAGGLCGRPGVFDLFVVHGEPVAGADALLGKCGDALFHGAEHFVGVYAGFVELAHQGARRLEGVAHLLKLRAELLHICHQIREAHTRALADLKDVVHSAAHVVGVDVPLLEGLARLLDHAAEVVPEHIAHLDGLLGDLLKLRAGEAEAGVVVCDRLAGVLHCGRDALVDGVEVIQKPIQRVAGGAGSDADSISSVIEGRAEILHVLSGLDDCLACRHSDAAHGCTNGQRLHVQAADFLLSLFDGFAE